MSLSPRLQPFKALFSSSTVRAAIAALSPGGHLGPDRVIAAALVQMGAEPELLDCDPRSVLYAVLQATVMGLEIGGALGMVYLRPNGRRCRLGFGYRGRLLMAQRAGAKSFQARVVRDGDDFEVTAGERPSLYHKPKLGGAARAISHFYATARVEGGELAFEVMDLEQIDQVRSQATGELVDAWVRNYVEQGRKAVLRRLCDYLPARMGAGEGGPAIDLDVDAILGVAELPEIDLPGAAAEGAQHAEEPPPPPAPEDPPGNPSLLSELLRQVAAARTTTQLNPVVLFAGDSVLTSEERATFDAAAAAKRLELTTPRKERAA